MPDRSNRNVTIWEEQSSPTSKARQPKEAVKSNVLVTSQAMMANVIRHTSK